MNRQVKNKDKGRRRMGQFRFSWLADKLARCGVKSSGGALILGLVIMFGLASDTSAHEIRPSIADAEITGDTLTLDLQLTLESIVAGIDQQAYADTDDAPQAERYDELRAMSPADLEALFREAWPDLSPGFLLFAGETDLDPQIESVVIPEVGQMDLSRDTSLRLTAQLPPDGSDVTVGLIAAYGPLIIRQVNAGEDAYAALLEPGVPSVPLPRQGYVAETAWDVFSRFIVQGFEHIIPKGLDHIVFVLGLFFFSLKMRPLLTQVTAFTLAHTVTLALAALGIVTISASIVEPLIAASIVFVAVENILRPQLGVWRTAVVFFFGLLHGLGFASVLGEVGGGQANFIARLIGFNIGVEIGQLAVILAAFLLVGIWFGKKDWYRARIAIPASLIIAAIGAYWFVERVFL